MKLFRVVFETDVMILANDAQEAIRNAQYYVKDEDPAFMYSDPVETINELNAHPKWRELFHILPTSHVRILYYEHKQYDSRRESSKPIETHKRNVIFNKRKLKLRVPL
jgi:hypothetical protein